MSRGQRLGALAAAGVSLGLGVAVMLAPAPASATPDPNRYLDRAGSVGATPYAYHWNNRAGNKCTPVTSFRLTDTRKTSQRTSNLIFHGQGDGNSVVKQIVTTNQPPYRSYTTVGWASGSQGRGVTQMCLQGDGNVTWKTRSGQVVKSLGTPHAVNSNLRFQISVWGHCATYKSYRKNANGSFSLVRQVNLAGRNGGPVNPCWYRNF